MKLPAFPINPSFSGPQLRSHREGKDEVGFSDLLAGRQPNLPSPSEDRRAEPSRSDEPMDAHLVARGKDTEAINLLLTIERPTLSNDVPPRSEAGRAIAPREAEEDVSRTVERAQVSLPIASGAVSRPVGTEHTPRPSSAATMPVTASPTGFAMLSPAIASRGLVAADPHDPSDTIAPNPRVEPEGLELRTLPADRSPLAHSPAVGATSAPSPVAGIIRALPEAWEAQVIPRRFEMVLEPARLGTVRIVMTLAGNRPSVVITTSSEAGFNALRADGDLLTPILRDVRGGDGNVVVVLQTADQGAGATSGGRHHETWEQSRERERPNDGGPRDREEPDRREHRTAYDPTDRFGPGDTI